MKIAVMIARIFACLVGAFWILMASDSFSTIDGSFWVRLAGFVIQAAPGVLMIVLVYVLRNHSFILGLIFIAATIALFIITKQYRDLRESYITILTMFLPLLLSGVVLLFDKPEKRKAVVKE